MFDIVVIGAGPAGMTAALYAARAGKSVCVMENTSFGGQISYSPHVENYPSVKSISGDEFSSNLLDQISDLGAKTVFEKATGISGDEIKTVETESGKKYECRAVVIATGVRHRHLGIENEERLVGKGVSYCAVCDGAFFKGKDVAVAGGGDTALQDAIYLSKICNKVYLIHRRLEFRAEHSLVEKVKSTENIELVLDSNVTELCGENKVEAVVVTDKNDNTTKKLSVSGIFIAVGQNPQNKDFAEVEKLDESGYFVTGETTVTATKGVFVAGDCRHKTVRQLTTAVADGSVAGTKACHYIDSL